MAAAMRRAGSQRIRRKGLVRPRMACYRVELEVMQIRRCKRFFQIVLLTAVAVLGACRRRNEPPRIAHQEVERCEKGIEQALLKPNTREALSTYYRECSVVYAEPACRQAFVNAASLEGPQQMEQIVRECRAAYCPIFKSKELEACKSGFEASQPNIVKAWPALNEAILRREARGYAPRLGRAMLVFYSRVVQRMGGQPNSNSGALGVVGSAQPATSAQPVGSVSGGVPGTAPGASAAAASAKP